MCRTYGSQFLLFLLFNGLKPVATISVEPMALRTKVGNVYPFAFSNFRRTVGSANIVAPGFNPA